MTITSKVNLAHTHLSSKDLIKLFEQQEKNKKKEIEKTQQDKEINPLLDISSTPEVTTAATTGEDTEETSQTAETTEYENDSFERAKNENPLNEYTTMEQIKKEVTASIKDLTNFKDLFGNNSKEKEEEIKDNVESQIKQVSGTRPIWEIIKAAVTTAKNDFKNETNETEKNQKDEEKDKNEKSIAENKLKDPTINTFMNAKNYIFDTRSDIEEDKEEDTAA